MNLRFRDPGLEYSLRSILGFQSEEQSDWFRESLFAFYPQIDRARFEAKIGIDREAYLRDALTGVYRDAQPGFAQKLERWERHWLAHRTLVNDAFSDAFALDASELFNDLDVRIALNPVCPRFLAERAFDVFHLNSERGALGMSLHEMVHFLWFHVWQEEFGDDPADYETPRLKWVLSEAAVEPVLRDPRLRSVNPYYDDGCAYAYFYNMRIDGRPFMESLCALYDALPVRTFMREAYALCQQHEAEIRAQML